MKTVSQSVRRTLTRLGSDESGMALMTVVAVSAIVFIMLATALTMVEYRDTQATKFTSRNRAMQLADAGINEYMYQLSEDYRFYASNPVLVPASAPADGTWRVEAEPPHDSELLTLTSTGTLADGTSRTVTATVKFPNFVDYCVFVIQDYSVGSGFTFDGKVYVQGWLNMATGSNITGLAMSSAGFKKDNNTLTLTNNRLAPGSAPYSGGAQKLNSPLTMGSVTNDLAAMATEAQNGGIYLPAYNAATFGTIPSSVVTDIDGESFASSTWPSDWSRSDATYARTTNTSGRVRSTYAAEVWANSTTRRTVTFHKDIDLRGFNSATLSFWNQAQGFAGGSDYARVEVSYNGGSSWTQLNNLTSSTGWSQRSFPLTGGGIARVRFSASVNATTEYANWDDIVVTGTYAYTARQGYRLTFTGATLRVEAVAWERQLDGLLGISGTAPLAAGFTVPIPANGIIFVNGPCWVQGTYSQKVTVAVPSPFDIIVPDNLLASSTSPKATCGLVAGGDVAFPHWYDAMPDDLYVRAAMLSQNGYVNIDRPIANSTTYYPPYWRYASAYASNKKPSVNLIGSRAMDNMGAGLAQGFVIRNSEPDPRLYDDPPPMYPNVQGVDLRIMSWTEG